MESIVNPRLLLSAPVPRPTGGDSPTAAATPGLSRRSFLGLSMSSGLAAFPVQLRGGRREQALRFKETPDNITISGDGVRTWRLRKASLGPHVRCKLERVSTFCREISLEWEGAAALQTRNIRLRFVRQSGVWRVTGQCFGSRSLRQVSAVEWLNAYSDIPLHGGALRALPFGGSRSGMSLSDGPFSAVLRNDLTVVMRGRRLCQIRFPETGSYKGDLAQLRLIHPRDSLIAGTSSAVLRVEMLRRRSRWPDSTLPGPLPKPFAIGARVLRPTSAAVEVASDNADPAVVTELRGPGDTSFRIEGPIFGRDGAPASLPVREISLIHAERGPTVEHFMRASLGGRQGYLFKTAAFEVDVTSGPQSYIQIVASRVGDASLHAFIITSQCDVAIPIHDSYTHVVATPVGSGLRIQTDTPDCIVSQGAGGATSVECTEDCAVFVTDKHARLDLSKVRLTVLRSTDFMAMEFTFRNLAVQVQSGFQGPYLVRGNATLPAPTGTVRPDPPPAIILVHFSPQTLTESSTFEDSNHDPPVVGFDPKDKSRVTLSGTARLAFEIPQPLFSQKPAFSIETLLAWEQFAMRVDPRAQSKVPPGFLAKPAPLADDVTSIDFFGLLFSPSERARWRHSATPLQFGSRTQLYHGLLFDGESDSDSVGWRALWSDAFTNNPANRSQENHCSDILGEVGADKTLESMSDYDKTSLVQLMSDYSLFDDARRQNYVPLPVILDYICLSTLGGSMSAHGAFVAPILDDKNPNDPEGIDVESWTHHSAFMRVDFDEVKYRYFAFPHGLRISLVKQTARVVYNSTNPVDQTGGSTNIACLRTQLFFEWVEKEIDFTQRPLPYPANSRQPFAQLHINEKTRRSPPLDDPCNPVSMISGVPDATVAFWPVVQGKPLKLNLQGFDVGGEPGLGGGVAPFGMPFIAVRGTEALAYTTDSHNVIVDRPVLQAVKAYYRNNTSVLDRRTVSLAGQYVHFSKAEKPGDSEFKTYRLLFDYDDVGGGDKDVSKLLQRNYWPRFVPATVEVIANIPAVEHLTGASRVSFSYATPYLQFGLRGADGRVPTGNQGQVSLQLLGEAPTPATMADVTLGASRWFTQAGGSTNTSGVGMQFPGGGTGGVLNPSHYMTGFSPPNGPIGGDYNDFALGKLNFGSFFQPGGSILPQLMGAIDLAEVLLPELDGIEQALAQIPNLENQVLGEIAGELLVPLKAVQGPLNTAATTLTTLATAIQKAHLLDAQTALKNAFECSLVTLGDDLVKQLFTGPSDYLPSVPPVTQTWEKIRAQIVSEGSCSTGALAAAVVTPAPSVCSNVCAGAASFQDLLTTYVNLLQQLSGAQALAQADIQDAIDAIVTAASQSFSWLADTADDIQAALKNTGALSDIVLIDPVSQLDLSKEINELQQIVNGLVSALEGGNPLPALSDGIQSFVADLRSLIRLAAKLDLTEIIVGRFETLKRKIASSLTRGTDSYNSTSTSLITSLKTNLNNSLTSLSTQWRTLSKTAAAGYLDQAKTCAGNLCDCIAATVDEVAAGFSQQIQTQVINFATTVAKNLEDQAAPLLESLTALQSQAQDLVDELLQPRLVKAHYSFSPTLRDGPEDQPIFVAQADGTTATLTLDVDLQIPFDPSNPGKTTPQIVVDGALSNFTLIFLPSLQFLLIEFDQVTFRSENGGKPDVNVKIKSVTFGSSLAFLSAFQDLMKIGDPSNGPYLIVDGLSVQAGYAYHNDKIVIGAFFIRNLGFDAHIELSLDNDPLIGSFSFASADKRFSVTYGIYGGGGYCTIKATPKGIQDLSIAIEGGAYSDFNCDIATGTAHAVIGFLYSKQNRVCEFTGYFDAGAQLDVLGLIHASLGFYLALSYESSDSGSKTYGICIVTVDIDFGLWTMHVGVTCYREFQSSGTNQKAAMAPGTHALALVKSPQPLQMGPGNDEYYALWDEYEAAFN